MTRKTALLFAAGTIRLACSSIASAAEKIIYTYDARGRLIKVERDPASTVNTNVKTEYTLDKADNRTNVTTTGAP